MNREISEVEFFPVFFNIDPRDVSKIKGFSQNTILMPELMSEGSNYITLKEAAQISGYSPDYLGQLIRKGKLAGKQVYLNVAWVTTEKALKEYLENNKVISSKSDFSLTMRGKFRRWVAAHSSGDEVIKIARRVIYVVIACMVAFCLFLAYALVVNIIRKFL